jgi:dephospho-CoA kinase
MVEFVVGLTGTIGSGKEVVKGTLARNFSSWGVSLSSVIKGELEKKRKDFNRKTLQDMGNELRKKYGNFVLAKVATDYLQKDKQMIIVDGIRNPGEAEYLKKTFGKKFILIGIDAPKEIRWERVKTRARKDDPKTWEEFVALDERDQGAGEDLYGQQVRRCIEMADVIMQNDGNMDQFNEKINSLVASLKVNE